MFQNLTEATERRSAIAKRLRAILDAAQAESRELTEDEAKEFDKLDAEAKTVTAWIGREERARELAREPVTRAAAPAPSGPDDPPIGTPKNPGRAPAAHTREDRAYSVLELARAAKGGYEASVERRASDEIAERVGRKPEGYYVPYAALLPQKQQRDITKASTGASLVADNLIPSEFIEILRDVSVVAQAGARMLTDLDGDVDLPRQTGAASASWLLAETTDLTGDTGFDSDTVTLTPKTVGIRVDVSRRMQKQSTPGIEDLTREDIRQVIGLEVDRVALEGDSAASSGEPDGIASTQRSGVGAVDVTTGGAITWADVVEFETDLATSNALRGSLAYVMANSLLGQVKTGLKDAGSGMFLMDPDGSMNGYPVFRKTAGPLAVFGNWQELLIGMWGVLDIFADPYTLGDRGAVVLRGFQDLDVQLRHNASFSVGS